MKNGGNGGGSFFSCDVECFGRVLHIFELGFVGNHGARMRNELDDERVICQCFVWVLRSSGSCETFVD